MSLQLGIFMDAKAGSKLTVWHVRFVIQGFGKRAYGCRLDEVRLTGQ